MRKPERPNACCGELRTGSSRLVLDNVASPRLVPEIILEVCCPSGIINRLSEINYVIVKVTCVNRRARNTRFTHVARSNPVVKGLNSLEAELHRPGDNCYVAPRRAAALEVVEKEAEVQGLRLPLV